MKLIGALILCLTQFQAFKAHVATAESQQVCRMPRELETKCGAYILQIVKPMLANAELIKQQIDKNDAQIESKATQLSELNKKYNKLYSEVNEWKESQSRKLEETQSSHKNEIDDKNNQIKILKETVTSLQIENSIYKTKEDIVNKISQTKKLEEKLTNLQIENTVYKTKEDSMAVVLKEIRSQMENVIAEQITNKDQNNQIKELLKQVNSHARIEERYEKQLKNQNSQIEELSMQVNSHARIEERYEKQLKNQNSQIEELSTQVNSHARIKEEYEKQLEKQNNEIKELSTQVNSYAKSKELQEKELKSCVTFGDSRVHTISLSKFDTFKVLCNSNIVGPGWTVIQQKNSEFNFNQNWTTFKNGFGKISDEDNFFLGLEKIHKLTINHVHELYILVETNNRNFYARYESFAIAGDQYTLHLGRRFEGDDILGEHENMKFSTYDNDNDKECASNHRSGWWYNDCGNCNFRKIYVTFDTQNDNWGQWMWVKKMTMMIRPMAS